MPNAAAMETIRASPMALPFATSQIQGSASPVGECLLDSEMFDLSSLPEWTVPDDNLWPPTSTIDAKGTEVVAEASVNTPHSGPVSTSLVDNFGSGDHSLSDNHASIPHYAERLE